MKKWCILLTVCIPLWFLGGPQGPSSLQKYPFTPPFHSSHGTITTAAPSLVLISPHPPTPSIAPSALQSAPPTPTPPAPQFTQIAAANGITLSSTASPVASATNLTRITRLVQTEFKYPLWRIEDIQRQDDSSTPPVTISRTIAVADHVLVRTRPGLSASSLRALCARHNVYIRKSLHSPGFYLIATTSTTPDTLPNLIASLSSETNSILYAEPDHILHTTQTLPNDTSFSSLWGLHNTGQSGGVIDADIDAPEAWDITTGAPNVIVGVIDSGVDLTHPDLATNIWVNPLETLNGLDDDGNGYIDDMNGWDFLSEDNIPSDANSHGTHCAGIIAATGNNGVGVVGATWQCRIMALRFLDASGNGASSDALEALYYAIDMHQRGINIRLTSNSWGGGGDQALSDAIRESGNAGMLFIAAAGNSAWNNDLLPFMPSSYPWDNIIAVASTDRRDALSSFSNYGASTVDLAAPGSEIYSTIPGSYGFKSGTSMATPYVAGVAALLWAEWPEADWTEVRNAILSSADRIPSLAGKTVTGGRLNAHKALLQLFHIAHTPMQNSINTGSPYTITTDVSPRGLVDTNQLWLFWNTDASTNFTASTLIPFGTNLYQGNIPLQPEGTTISYWLKAVSSAGSTATHPTNAPLITHRFTIMPPLALSISGSPGNHGSVIPDYGEHTLPSGLVVEASASLHSTPSNNARWTCLGWTGSGSVPAAGQSNATTFTLEQASTIDWSWSREFALSQTASLPGLQSTTTWWTANSTGITLTASTTLTLGGTNYTFAHWLLDDTRQPDPSQPAVNPVSDVLMSDPHQAIAIYLPDFLDADNDGIADWWEYHFFGSTNISPDSDDDSDGFSNLDEFLDRTLPREPDNLPTPPVIQHSALHDPQTHPAPYTVEAVVTDNFVVAEVTLEYILSGGPIQTIPMLPSGPIGVYGAELPAPGTNGDVFTYWILAQDPLGLTATNGPNFVHITYPLLGISPTALYPLVFPQSETNLPLRLANLGNTNMLAEISMLPAGYLNTFDDTVTGWTSSGAGNLWALSTNRTYSPPSAWYCGDPSNRLYTSSMHARLDTPPIYLSSNAWMSFNHWIDSELDTHSWVPGWQPMHAWDGGIVEISTNGGLSFEQITPTNGYPYAISGWSLSPWPDDTPCFAGSGEWNHAVFNLAPFAGRLAIIRFHFGSDSNTEEEGWYLDDLIITPAPTNAPWLSWSPTNLVIPPAGTATVEIAYTSGSIPTGDREAALLVTCNDPTAPLTLVPQHMRVRSPPVLSLISASQTSTNGEGWVTLSNTVFDADGEPCGMEIDWSTNGLAWTGAWVRAAVASAGTPDIHASSAPQVDQITTLTNAILFTNSLAITWDTSSSGNGLGYSPSTLLRTRLWDGLLWSPWTTSQPFTVDNIPPPSPTRFTNMTHTANNWSTNPVMTLVWRRVIDAGLSGYCYQFWTNTPGDAFNGFTTDTSGSSPPLPDNSNWWTSVQSRDSYGNLSPILSLGPFKTDTTPPTPTGATITLVLTPGASCLIDATNITASWTGFTDTGSGIARYICALTNLSPATNGVWTTLPAATLTDLLPDSTNYFNVWAMDNAGLVGLAASAPFLVLSANGDWDGDGMINASEATAGTDPTAAGSLFLLDIQSPGSNSIMVLQWPSATNRLYTLAHNETLLPPGTNWTIMTNWVRIPGVGGIMNCTDQVENIPVRFYRITVEKP